MDNDDLLVDWTLHDATVTAIAPSGEVYNETGLTLKLVEGRHLVLHPVGGGLASESDPPPMREVWSYRLEFYLADGKEPYEATQRPCQIAITGSLKDGRPCKIMGKGHVGRDDHGQIEGTFYVPPRIEIIGAEEEFIESDEDEAATS
ncbi:hypothetical protein NCF86_00130 [Pelagerythrobacter marinus]|nr:hypothetical protein NCF86_00130 [Pelagerythrobacter marinus]